MGKRLTKEECKVFIQKANDSYDKWEEAEALLDMAKKVRMPVEDVIRVLLMEHKRVVDENEKMVKIFEDIRQCNCSMARDNFQIALALGEAKKVYETRDIKDILMLKALGYTHQEVSWFMNTSVSTITRCLRKYRRAVKEDTSCKVEVFEIEGLKLPDFEPLDLSVGWMD